MDFRWTCSPRSIFGLVWLFPFVSACSQFFDYTYSLAKVFPQAKGRLRTQGWRARTMRSCSISHQTRTAGKVLGTLITVSFQNNSSSKESVFVCVCVRERASVCSVTQSCPILCDPVDCSPPASSVHGILQARMLEWGGAISFSGIFPTQGSSPSLFCLWH